MSDILLRKIVHFDSSSSRSCSIWDARNWGLFKKRWWIPLQCFLMHLFFKLWAWWYSFCFGVFPYLWRWGRPFLITYSGIEREVHCTLDNASVGCTFFQEMPACAVDDAFASVWWAFFALRLRVCLEHFKQLYVAHVLNHFLGRRTERVVGFVVVDLVEEIVNEDDSRSSSRVREHGSFLLVSLHVAIQTLWSQCLFPRTEWTNPLVVHLPTVRLICVYDYVCVFVFINTFNRHWHTTLAELWSIHKSPRAYVGAFPDKQDIFLISWVNEPDGCTLTGLSVLDTRVFDFGWICWESLLVEEIVGEGGSRSS